MNKFFYEMPKLLQLLLLANCVIGALQMLSLAIPELAPNIDGKYISNFWLCLLMSLAHFFFALVLVGKLKYFLFIIFFFPLIQYGILYLDHGLPESEMLAVHLFVLIIWFFLSGVYFIFFGGKEYFLS